ncbi:hypothetical protein EB169_10015 [archaeon]|nr:hypothetical protein [archaeon]
MNNPSFYLTLDLPKNFTREDAEKIRNDLLDFLESKKHYGAKYDGKNGIAVKIISVSTNHD